MWASGSLKEESVKSQEFWRVARNIGQRGWDKKKGGGSGPRFATEPGVYVCGSRSFHTVLYDPDAYTGPFGILDPFVATTLVVTFPSFPNRIERNGGAISAAATPREPGDKPIKPNR